MPTALYNKYRPKRFRDIKGQLNTKVLINSIKRNQIYPAYIFQGSVGTGKTTSARVFAQTINCNDLDALLNPCFVCISCLNPHYYLMEVNCAIKRGIEDIKKIIKSSFYRPKSGKYRVILFDECTQLSTDALTALLKVVEEPPDHASFIFCTTDNLYGDTKHSEALTTLSSRCIMLLFNPIDDDVVMREVKSIARKEKIVLKENTIRLIARKAKGSMRDAIGMIDLYYLMQDITPLVTPEEDYALKLLQKFSDYSAVDAIHEIEDNFLEPSVLWVCMVEFIRDIVFCKCGIEVLHTEEVQEIVDGLSKSRYDWLSLQQRMVNQDMPKTYLELQSKLLGL